MSITAEQLMVEVKADVRQALAQLDRVERRAGTSSGRMAKMGKSLGLAFSGTAVLGGIKKTIDLAKDYDLTMRQVGVQTGATGQQMKGLSALAMKMGADTKFSAQDAAGAMLELAKGGLTQAQIKAGALKTTMTLAAAGGLDLANAATYVTQGMTTFGLKAQDANQVAIALAGGANASTASVESLGQALSQVGPGAKNAGLSLQDTVAVLSAFDNAGIKGSDAGTSLKTMLARLVPQTKQARDAMNQYGLSFVKADGSFRSITAIADQLRTKLSGLTQEQKVQALQTIFGSDATRAATVLMNNGAKGLAKYTSAVRDGSTVQKMAKTSMEGAAGAWEQFTGSVETAAIKVGTKMLPMFTKAANKGSDFINEAMTWGPQIKETFAPMVSEGKLLVKALTPIAKTVVAVGKAFGNLPGPVKSTIVQGAIAYVLFPRIAAAISTVGTNAMIAGTRVIGFGQSLSTASGRAAAATATMTKLGGAARLAAGVGGFALLSSASQDTGKKMKTSDDAVKSSLKTFAGFAAVGGAVAGPLGAVAGGAVGAAVGFIKLKNNMAAVNAEFNRTNFGEQTAQLGSYKGAIDSVTEAVTKQGRAMVARDLIANGSMAAARKLGVSSKDLIAATLGQEGALKRVRAAMKAATDPNQGTLLDAMGGKDQNQAITKVMDAIGDKVNTQRQKVQAAKAAMIEYRLSLTSLPANVQTSVMALGTKPAAADIAALRDQYHLTPKVVQTILKALGTDVTIGQVNKVKGALKDTGNVKPNLDPWTAAIGKATASGKAKAATGSKGVGAALSQGTVGSKANMSGWLGSISSGTKTGKARATSGGRGVKTALSSSTNGTRVNLTTYVASISRGVQSGKSEASKSYSIGSALKSGVMAGLGGLAGALAGGVVGAVHGALAAGRRAAQIHSPSRLWREKLGQPLGDGVALGIQDRVSAAGDAAVRLATTAAKRAKTAWQKILDQRQKNFVSNAYQGMASQANVLNSGATAADISANLGIQVQKVKDFAGMLKKLKAMGYSNAIINQIAQAGVEGGFDVAQALVAATPDQVKSITQNFQAIKDIAKNQSKGLGKTLYQSGTRVADGVVDALKARSAEIERSLTRAIAATRPAVRAAMAPTSSARTAPPTPSAAALSGGAGGAGGVTFSFMTVNPQAEPQSVTTNKALQRVSTLALV